MALNPKLVFERFGPPEQVLQYREEEFDPQLEDDQVLVELCYASINPAHLLAVLGKYQDLPNLPATPGTEATGRVYAIGQRITDVEVGQSVVLVPNALKKQGTWQRFVVARPQDLLPIDPRLEKVLGGSMINALTALISMEEIFSLERYRGKVVAVSACYSSLSLLYAQLAKHYQATVIGLARRPHDDEEAHKVYDKIVYFDLPQETKPKEAIAVLKPAFPHGIDCYFDQVGGLLSTALLSLINPHGHVVSIAFLSGKPMLVFTPVLFQGISIKGFWVSRYVEENPRQEVIAKMKHVIDLIEKKVLVPKIDRTFPLKDYQAAIAYLKNPRRGKVLFSWTEDREA